MNDQISSTLESLQDLLFNNLSTQNIIDQYLFETARVFGFDSLSLYYNDPGEKKLWCWQSFEPEQEKYEFKVSDSSADILLSKQGIKWDSDLEFTYLLQIAVNDLSIGFKGKLGGFVDKSNMELYFPLFAKQTAAALNFKGTTSHITFSAWSAIGDLSGETSKIWKVICRIFEKITKIDINNKNLMLKTLFLCLMNRDENREKWLTQIFSDLKLIKERKDFYLELVKGAFKYPEIEGIKQGIFSKEEKIFFGMIFSFLYKGCFDPLWRDYSQGKLIENLTEDLIERDFSLLTDFVDLQMVKENISLENRNYKRFSIFAKSYLKKGDRSEEVAILDISAGGAAVIIKPEAQTDFTTLQIKHPKFDLISKVKLVKTDNNLCRFQFDDFPHFAQSQFDALLHKINS